MALYSKLTEAWENHDVEAYWACFHPDWEMTWHSTGKVTNLNSMSAEQMKAIMENADITNRRCIYENDDILVQAAFARRLPKWNQRRHDACFDQKRRALIQV